MEINQKHKKNNKFAFFDVDNTIYKGYSAEDFIEFAAHEGFIAQKYPQTYSEIIEKCVKKAINYNKTVQKILDLVSEAVGGKKSDQTNQLVIELLNQKDSLFFDWVIPVIEKLLQKDFNIVLVSAAPDFVIHHLGKRIKAQHYFATPIPSQNNVFLGEPTKALNASAKVEAINSITDQNSFIIGFGDSTGDIPLFKSCNKSYVFLTEHFPQMKKIANQNKWSLFNKKEDIINNINQLP
jgi:HAD superfamily phosphoserine phosphatase-like hydrolase